MVVRRSNAFTASPLCTRWTKAGARGDRVLEAEFFRVRLGIFPGLTAHQAEYHMARRLVSTLLVGFGGMSLPERISERRRVPLLAMVMLLVVAVIGSLAYLDERREQDAALDDFAQEQASLAAGAATRAAAPASPPCAGTR